MKTSDILLGKLNTEFKAVSAMIEIYCKKNHHSEALCKECQQLMDYAEVRLDRCPYGENKPTCNTCPIHCYKPEPKEQMRLVMRFSGPRMLLNHPILAIRHLLSEKKNINPKPSPNCSNRHIRLQKGEKK
ncbi:nitrous oxide-stimulated promoter family protein [Aliivibrio finisterrensis]|uniref:nitrous oxide-stimulated promoter family protein n=1 Tax=Aliivibrio finisterrensis TaxID=511998 RepID=UPI00101EC28A|nr:nitrous oxide-stimulated promoter family protein [Aliivibrio finisterrensis]RYU56470.1 nitrous oxide-stimulated promoter family protein [Aliivibrio finisterrensis]RYU61591.1 nitrous oxide-stimulated promoter family protein [Aliivibrio finisterrensis]RYU89725.1 nitrous oxide-stimulated promoter family protein [Aliivibrio finisterrensis]